MAIKLMNRITKSGFMFHLEWLLVILKINKYKIKNIFSNLANLEF